MQNLTYPDPDYNLWVLLSHARRAMMTARQRELKKYKITPRQAAVFNAIVTIGEKVTPADISRWLFREPHSISEFLKRMERKGFLKRVKDLERKNMVRVVLTEKGEEAYRDSIKLESMHKIMATLSKKERENLGTILKKLINASLEEMHMSEKDSFLL